MTVTLDVEVGDKVTFKDRLPKHEFVVTHAPDDGSESADVIHWQAKFSGLNGLVDCVDIQQQLVRVRGKDENGNDYTVWIEPRYLEIYSKGMDL